MLTQQGSGVWAGAWPLQGVMVLAHKGCVWASCLAYRVSWSAGTCSCLLQERVIAEYLSSNCSSFDFPALRAYLESSR
jgi:hypothetical protein